MKSNTQKDMKMPPKSERDLALEQVNQRAVKKQNKKLVVDTLKKELHQIRTVENISNIVPQDRTWVQEKMEEARERIKSGIIPKDDEGFYTDGKGHIFMDVSKIIFQEDATKRKVALSRHGNNFNTRMDECGFPFDRKDRKFILTHPFKNDLDFIMSNIRKSWVYIYGDPGRGKTSLATRAVWEMLKNYPEREATFLSIGKWVKSLMAGNEEYINLDRMKKIVLIDDFDKFDKKKDFQVKQLLLLIEELKNRHLVIITSNHSMEEILKSNSDNLDLEVMIDRIRGKSIALPRFTGQSFR